jgi:hypothetical protein
VGFFKDARKLNKMGKQMYMDMDVGAQMQQAQASMAQAQQFMTQQTQAAQMGAQVAAAPGDALRGTATITALRNTGMLVDYQPVVEIDLLVTPEGQAPYPSTQTATITVENRMVCSPGRAVQVAIDPADRTRIWIDWAGSEG